MGFFSSTAEATWHGRLSTEPGRRDGNTRETRGNGGTRRALGIGGLYERLGYADWFKPGAERELLSAMRTRLGEGRVLFSRDGFNAV
jgi:hypothetical protein